MRRFIIEQSKTNFYTSHSGLALVGLCINRYSSLPAKAKKAFPVSQPSNGIGLDDILRSYVGMLSLGQSDYEAVTNRKNDDYFKKSLGVRKIPSAETLRQRFDEVSEGLQPLVDGCCIEFLKKSKALITPLDTGHIALDCDVFPMDNSKTQKEGVSRIYNGEDGYAPIAAYLGREGWCLELELREGKQHSQNGFIPFLARVLGKASALTSRKLLVRLDSAHDAIETRSTLANREKVSYIIKWNTRREDVKLWAERIFKKGKVFNPRPGKRVGILTVHIRKQYQGKTYRFKRVMRATERTIDKRGQLLLTPDVEVDGWWTTLDLPEERVIKLYEDRGTSEQFHSEIKSDMDMERLPSGKFSTNALILTLAGFVYNILRYIGQLGLIGEKTPVRHPAKRRRIKTVIQELMYLAGHFVETGRRLKLVFSRYCPGFEAFQELYLRLANG
ncbi:MAG: IS1380 family transposase [Pseudomonadota bacterium]